MVSMIMGGSLKQVEEVARDPKLEALLQELREKDDFYEYNVPASLLRVYSDEKLLEYLEDAYSHSLFVMQSKEIEKHLEIGDRVIKVGDFEQITETLETSTAGRFVEWDGHPKINFYDSGVWTFNQEEIANLCVVGRIRTKFFDGKEVVKYMEQKIPLSTFRKEVTTDHWIRYEGEKIEKKEGDKIPDGAEGIVVNIYTTGQHLTHIAWARQPGLIQRPNTSDNRTKPSCWYDSNSYKLVRPNYIDFEKLFHKHMRGEEE